MRPFTFGANAAVPDFGVDGIGEVDRRGIAGQNHDLTLGGEGVNLLRVEIDLEGGKKFMQGSETSRCHSTTWRSQARRCSSSAKTGPSLYFQCAAMPSSAILCISSVRIWTSKGVPSSEITEVCRD